MSNSSVRIVALFSIIALVLVGATLGGVRLIKARNSSHATPQHTIAQTGTKQQPAQQQKKDISGSTKPQTQNNQNSNTSQPQTAVPPANNSTTQAPSASDKGAMATPAPVTAQQNSSLPATSGFSPVEVLPTVALMVLAGFFGSKLMRARADYRRYIES